MNEFRDIPFRLHGRERDGCDCWGLVRLVYRERYGIDLPSYCDEYNETLTDRSAAAIARHQGDWTRVSQPEEGDVVLLRVMGVPNHVGIVCGPGLMLHTTHRTGRSLIERYTHPRWNIEGVYRYGR